MKTTPFVSIIIPTYNQQAYIGPAIESALAQDYPNFEVVVADDCSTDQTGVIAQSYQKKDARLKYFRNAANLGRVKNYRQALYELAGGEYALNLDGDDLLIDPSLISKSIGLLEKHTGAKMVVACKQAKLKDRTFQIMHKIPEEIVVVPGTEFVLGISQKYEFSHLTTVYNRKDALAADFYRENIISTDKESLLRLALTGDVVVYNKVAGQWNQTGGNESFNQKFADAVENLRWIENVHQELVKKTSREKAFFWKKWMIRLYATLIARSVNAQGGITFPQISLLIRKGIFTTVAVSMFRLSFKRLFGKRGR